MSGKLSSRLEEICVETAIQLEGQAFQGVSLFGRTALRLQLHIRCHHDNLYQGMLLMIPSEKARYIVKRLYLDGYTEKEVATELQLSQQAVSKWKKNGPLSIDWTHGIEKITQHNRTFVRIEWV